MTNGTTVLRNVLRVIDVYIENRLLPVKILVIILHGEGPLRRFPFPNPIPDFGLSTRTKIPGAISSPASLS